jgi:hypothetical protein
MNIYEDEQLEKKIDALTDQLGHFLLDMLLVSLQRINHENMIFREFEEVRHYHDGDDVLF